MAGGSEQSPDVPEDSASLYLPMKTFVVEHFKGSYSRFNKWLNKHPEVSTRPRGGRGRNVHAIEFHKAYEKEKKENFKKLDNSKDAQKKQGEQTARKKAEILRQRGVSEEEIAKNHGRNTSPTQTAGGRCRINRGISTSTSTRTFRLLQDSLHFYGIRLGFLLSALKDSTRKCHR